MPLPNPFFTLNLLHFWILTSILLSFGPSPSIFCQALECYTCAASLSEPTGCQKSLPKTLTNCTSSSTSSPPLCTSIFVTNVVATTPENELLAGSKGCVSPGHLSHHLFSCFTKIPNFPLDQTLDKCLAKRLSKTDLQTLHSTPECLEALQKANGNTKPQKSHQITPSPSGSDLEDELVEIVVCSCSRNRCNSQNILNDYLVHYIGNPATEPPNHPRKMSTRPPKPLKINYHAKKPTEEYLGAGSSLPETTNLMTMSTILLLIYATT